MLSTRLLCNHNYVYTCNSHYIRSGFTKTIFLLACLFKFKWKYCIVIRNTIIWPEVTDKLRSSSGIYISYQGDTRDTYCISLLANQSEFNNIRLNFLSSASLYYNVY